MNISRKCQYALRAVFELAKRSVGNPTTVGEIAEAQAIPLKFLEFILGELRHGGFVESRRGIHGGYLLAVAPGALSVGDIIRFVDGPFTPVRCVAGDKGTDCPLHGNCAFMGMWRRAGDAVAEVYDSTTVQDLIDEEQAACSEYVASYCI
ncbi:MAG: Rrf2 family transcriptional regulator [Planctomycetes bacterium]|nr:Rrf2 family transcriptional regulator [Planctomycetota bacterium]